MVDGMCYIEYGQGGDYEAEEDSNVKELTKWW